MVTEVRGAHAWPTNAELLADVFAVHVPVRAWARVVDVTYGAGVWWRIVGEPDVRHGLAGDNPKHFDDGVDFRALPEADCSFDVVAFDPPYVAPGGRKTSTIPEFNARYGIATTPPTPMRLQELIYAGLIECERVLRPGGLLLVKCKDYVWGGRYWPGAYLTLRYAGEILEMEVVDRFEHLGEPGPQPATRNRKALLKAIDTARRAAGRPLVDLTGLDDAQVRRCAAGEGVQVDRAQHHARRNHSTLFVLRRTRPEGQLL